MSFAVWCLLGAALCYKWELNVHWLGALAFIPYLFFHLDAWKQNKLAAVAVLLYTYLQ